ncbi:MAG: hypothetical protein CMC96_04550 [Flavobacteriales bacterium]|nr:hypothetical protein [Flavobacteriales bacterium]|tara:strand:+ start:2112 stop:2519 length:408 start_codon:yes stop_codon:yes gene_type:complete
MNTKVILGLILGAIVMYLVYPNLPDDYKNNEKDLPIDYAKVEQKSGIMIFMESNPVDKDAFKEVGRINNGLLEKAIEDILSKDKHWTEKALGIFQGASYHEKLNSTLQLVTQDYDKPDAIILRNGFKECIVLKLR